MGLRFFTSDKVNHGQDASLDNIAAGTVMAGVYRAEITGGHNRIVTKGDAFTDGEWFYFSNTGNLQFFRGRVTSSTTAAAAVGTFVPQLGALHRWFTVAAVWDSGGVDADQRLYAGDEAHPMSEPSSYAAQTVGSGAFGDNDLDDLIVGSRAAVSQPIDGIVAWVGIWRDRLLTRDDLRVQQKDPHRTAGNVLLCHYGMHSASAQLDQSGKGNHGTNSGAELAPHIPIDGLFSTPPRIVRPVYPDYTAKRV